MMFVLDKHTKKITKNLKSKVEVEYMLFPVQ